MQVPPFREAIASWSARTPAPSWIEVRLRARTQRGWTRWYALGVWAETDASVARRSVSDQSDALGEVDVDVARLRVPADACQLEVRLVTRDPSILPVVSTAAVMTSPLPAPPEVISEPLTRTPVRLPVPPRSQMTYLEGGENWCSPTATAMVLEYFGARVQVPQAARDTYDATYRGCGNWAFNVAYAARFGMEAYVARFASLTDLERWVRAGVPLVASYAWKDGELAGAPVDSSRGHLGVVIGFDERGDVVMNDPAGADEGHVRRIYRRGEFERLWLQHSGGTVYVIHPRGQVALMPLATAR